MSESFETGEQYIELHVGCSHYNNLGWQVAKHNLWHWTKNIRFKVLYPVRRQIGQKIQMTVKTAYNRMLHAQTIQFQPMIFCPGQCNIKFTQHLDRCQQNLDWAKYCNSRKDTVGYRDGVKGDDLIQNLSTWPCMRTDWFWFIHKLNHCQLLALSEHRKYSIYGNLQFNTSN